MAALLAPRVWNDISKAAASCTRPAHVAVAYFGQRGDRLLPLPAGSFLVADVSIPVVSAGSTCPAALENLRKSGVRIYSARNLHAKVYAFDKVAFVGSANVSYRSKETLVEAVIRIREAAALSLAREFVASLCMTNLTKADLDDLSSYYRPPKFSSPISNPRLAVKQAKYTTLLMELTREQGVGRITQVQPPKAVWENYFGVRLDVQKLPILTLVNHSAAENVAVRRHVVRHHHNLTIELPGTELPRPAILEMRRLARTTYYYRVYRPSDDMFGSKAKLLHTLPNPLWEPGRRWVMV